MKKDQRESLNWFQDQVYVKYLTFVEHDFSHVRVSETVELRLILCFWDIGNGKQHKYCI